MKVKKVRHSNRRKNPNQEWDTSADERGCRRFAWKRLTSKQPGSDPARGQEECLQDQEGLCSWKQEIEGHVEKERWRLVIGKEVDSSLHGRNVTVSKGEVSNRVAKYSKIKRCRVEGPVPSERGECVEEKNRKRTQEERLESLLFKSLSPPVECFPGLTQDPRLRRPGRRGGCCASALF